MYVYMLIVVIRLVQRIKNIKHTSSKVFIALSIWIKLLFLRPHIGCFIINIAAYCIDLSYYTKAA